MHLLEPALAPNFSDQPVLPDQLGFNADFLTQVISIKEESSGLGDRPVVPGVWLFRLLSQDMEGLCLGASSQFGFSSQPASPCLPGFLPVHPKLSFFRLLVWRLRFPKLPSFYNACECCSGLLGSPFCGVTPATNFVCSLLNLPSGATLSR